MVHMLVVVPTDVVTITEVEEVDVTTGTVVDGVVKVLELLEALLE